eukprot:9948325-Ditylum_brightwellii.AAC.1
MTQHHSKAAVAFSAALRSAGAAGDYKGMNSPEEEVLCQLQILESHRRNSSKTLITDQKLMTRVQQLK